MQEPDYFSIMENKIKYYSRKYDPYSRYMCESLRLQQKELKKKEKDSLSFDVTGVQGGKLQSRRVHKVTKGLQKVLAIFF